MAKYKLTRDKIATFVQEIIVEADTFDEAIELAENDPYNNNITIQSESKEQISHYEVND